MEQARVDLIIRLGDTTSVAIPEACESEQAHKLLRRGSQAIVRKLRKLKAVLPYE